MGKSSLSFLLLHVRLVELEGLAGQRLVWQVGRERSFGTTISVDRGFPIGKKLFLHCFNYEQRNNMIL